MFGGREGALASALIIYILSLYTTGAQFTSVHWCYVLSNYDHVILSVAAHVLAMKSQVYVITLRRGVGASGAGAR